MKKALCVGINDYMGTANDLRGCVNDANDWKNFLESIGFDVTMIFNSGATRANVTAIFSGSLDLLNEGDEFVFTYSGHGTQVLDASMDEADGYDEALYMYDGTLLDDALRVLIDSARGRGVKITIVLDSCFSGTGTRKIAKSKGTPRFIQTDIVKPATSCRRRAFEFEEQNMIEVLLTGCSDKEYSYDAYINGRWNGAFTYSAIDILRNLGWDSEEEKFISFDDFENYILAVLPSNDYPQTPQVEGSAANKDAPMFGVAEAPDPIEPPDDEDPPKNKKWMIYVGIALVVILWCLFNYLLKC